METFNLSSHEKQDLLNELFTYFNFVDFSHFFDTICDSPAYDEILEELYRIARPKIRRNFAAGLLQQSGHFTFDQYYLVAEGNGKLSVVATADNYGFAALIRDGLKSEGWDVEIWRAKDGTVLSLFEDGSNETLV